MCYSEITYQTVLILLKKFSDSMFSFESDKMTPLWQNDSLTFTFYATFWNNIPNWTGIEKGFSNLMLSDEMTAVWSNDS